MATKRTSKSADSKALSAPGTDLKETEVRTKAEQLYRDRIAKGIPGTPEEDWFKAEQILKEVR